MDIDSLLEETQLVILLRKAHMGDAKARDEYQELMNQARDSGDDRREIYLYYLKERVLRQILEECADDTEKYIEWLKDKFRQGD